ncbi:MAG TPA: hypothetical protein VFJ13_04965 [Paracoccaceae bacterium]|nr:hypothetical protein [Paracoccaceae bacterium]
MRNMLEAEKQALEPLLRESTEALGLDEEQMVDMEGFLAQAWIAGALAGHANMTAKVLDHPLDLGDFEARIKPLVEESADTLNLTVNQTLHMWDYLSQAMVAGVKASETELMAMLIERKHDVGDEALQWLEERRDGA